MLTIQCDQCLCVLPAGVAWLEFHVQGDPRYPREASRMGGQFCSANCLVEYVIATSKEASREAVQV